MAETIAKSEEESLQELTDGLQGLQNAMTDLSTQVAATGQAFQDLLNTQDRLAQETTAKLDAILSMATKLAQSQLITAAGMEPILQQSTESGQKQQQARGDSSLFSSSAPVAAADDEDVESVALVLLEDTALPVRSEVIVKSDDGDSSTGSRTGASFDLARQRPAWDNPPSKLIGQFFHKQEASGDISLDMELEMDELCPDKTVPPKSGQMDLEQKQAEIIEQFVKQASALKDSALGSVVAEATSHPTLFALSEILTVPNVVEPEGTENSVYLDLLHMFAHDTWNDCKRYSWRLPQLGPDQVLKFKQLTVLTVAETNKFLPYNELMQPLDVKSVRALEDFLINECRYAGIVREKLDQLRRCFEVQFAAGRVLRPEQLGNMIQTLSSWLVASDNLPVTIQEKIKWAVNMILVLINAALGSSWKDILRGEQILEGKRDPGRPAILSVSSSDVLIFKILNYKSTRKKVCYGFVEFVSNAAAEKILQSIHGALLPNSDQSFRLNWATLVPVRGVKMMVLNLQFSWEVWLLMLMSLHCKSRLNQCTRLLKEQKLSLTEPDAILKVLSLDVMGNYGIRQDVVAVNSLLSAICCEDNQTTMAWEFFEKIKEKIPPDGDTFAILLDWDKESNLQKPKSTLDAMVVGVGWCPKNTPTYEAVLMTLVRASQVEEAVELLQAMKQNNCLPGMKFFSYTLDFIIKENDVAHAISLWDITVDGGLAPNLIVCNAMIGLLCHNNRIDDAFELFDGMIFHGVFPDSLSYNMIFSCLIKNRKVHDAGKFFLEMLKNEFPPTQPNCVAAIAMLFEGDDPAAAFDIWYYMVQNHVKPIDDSANAVLVGLGNLGRLTELKRFAEDMLDQRIRIDEYTMEILRTTFYKQGTIFRDKFDSLKRKWKAL